MVPEWSLTCNYASFSADVTFGLLHGCLVWALSKNVFKTADYEQTM